MRLESLVFIPFFALLAHPAAAESSNQIVVPAVTTSGVQAHVAPIITDLILEALWNRHGVRALGPADLKDMLTVEQQRQLVGCSESNCMSELAGALGARHLVSGLIGKLGSTFVLTLKLIDTQTARATARASKKFARLDDAADAVGPLVDQLFGKRPRARPMPPPAIASAPPAKPQAPPMTVKSFCRRAKNRYLKGLRTAQSVSALTPIRKALLEDLLRTPFMKDLEDKRACLSHANPALAKTLENRWRAARSPAEAQDAERRHLEWARIHRQIDLVVEAYRLGIAKEKNGTGTRPTALPFAVKEPTPTPRPQSERVAQFISRYTEAQETVQDALAAVNANKKRKFTALWSETSNTPRMSPRDTWVEALRDSDTFALDACPLYVRAPKDIETDAKARTESTIRGCIRKVTKKSGEVLFEPVDLIRQDGRWQIARWKAPPKKRR